MGGVGWGASLLLQWAAVLVLVAYLLVFWLILFIVTFACFRCLILRWAGWEPLLRSAEGRQVRGVPEVGHGPWLGARALHRREDLQQAGESSGAVCRVIAGAAHGHVCTLPLRGRCSSATTPRRSRRST